MDTLSRDPTYLHKLVMQDLHEPVVFHGLIEKWPASVWTPQYLASVLGDKEIKMRIGLKEAKEWESTQWESNCSYETTTLSNFCIWLRQSQDKPQNTHDVNPLLKYDAEKYWCYIDYKYMVQLFKDHPDILKAIMWRDFGFESRNGEQSTLWIGSEGATTPGHYDTYGCNLVAQIYGRKTWHLFHPDQSSALYQTRVPYEESSVFSPINISNPDLTKYPQFSTATPYIVTLDPGDILFVPHHWWHFVESLETSISVNTWIEMDTDHEARFHESVTRMLASGILSASGNHDKSKWLNPTEELYDSSTNLMCLIKAHEGLQNQPSSTSSTYSSQQQSSLTSVHQSSYNIIERSHSASNSGTNQTQLASLSDSPVPKRKKQIPDSELTKYDVKLPHFVTPVPCLGQIYQKQNTAANFSSSSHHKGRLVQSAPSWDGTTLLSEDGTGFKRGSDIIGGEEMVQEVNPALHPSGGGMTKDVLKIFLESVTVPDIVRHIGAIFCQKMKEAS